MYKVLITTSGTGSRLGELTKETNKSLVLLKGKPIINYIVEVYPEDIELVIALGYYGDKVRSHLEKTYPKRKFNFVTVDKYQGEGTSLGYSMLQAEKELQCPFIFHCNDTVVKGPIPSSEESNWNGGSKGQDPVIYNVTKLSSYIVENGMMIVMNRKGAEKYDLFHIGLAGFKDYDKFWKNLRMLYNQNPNDTSLNDCAAIQLMIKEGCQFKSIEFSSWFDTGNLEALDFAERSL